MANPIPSPELVRTIQEARDIYRILGTVQGSITQDPITLTPIYTVPPVFTFPAVYLKGVAIGPQSDIPRVLVNVMDPAEVKTAQTDFKPNDDYWQLFQSPYGGATSYGTVFQTDIANFQAVCADPNIPVLGTSGVVVSVGCPLVMNLSQLSPEAVVSIQPLDWCFWGPDTALGGGAPPVVYQPLLDVFVYLKAFIQMPMKRNMYTGYWFVDGSTLPFNTEVCVAVIPFWGRSKFHCVITSGFSNPLSMFRISGIKNPPITAAAITGAGLSGDTGLIETPIISSGTTVTNNEVSFINKYYDVVLIYIQKMNDPGIVPEDPNFVIRVTCDD